MSHAALKPWTEAEFFAWHDGQEDRHEFVDGFPRAMTRGNNRHTEIVFHALRAFMRRLEGGPCRPRPFETGIRIPTNGNVRYPDLTVDCGPYRPQERVAAEPLLVLEVLSPSTRTFDRTRKLEEYRSVAELRHIVLLDPDAPRAQLYTRDGAGAWQWQVFEEAGAALPLVALDLTLPLAECYDGALT